MARYITEECYISEKSAHKPGTKVRNLLTIGTPNMGYQAIPKGLCQKLKVDKVDVLCKFEKQIFEGVGLSDFFQ